MGLMGQSTDGILCWGINFGEDVYFMREEEQPGPGLDEWELSQELEKDFNCKLVKHCSCEYPMYIVAVKDSYFRASRGLPQALTEKQLHVAPSWRDTLEKGVDFFLKNIENYAAEDAEQEPGWILCSNWC